MLQLLSRNVGLEHRRSFSWYFACIRYERLVVLSLTTAQI